MEVSLKDTPEIISPSSSKVPNMNKLNLKSHSKRLKKYHGKILIQKMVSSDYKSVTPLLRTMSDETAST